MKKPENWTQELQQQLEDSLIAIIEKQDPQIFKAKDNKYRKRWNKTMRKQYKTNPGGIQRQAAKRRNMDWILLFNNPFSCPIDYHHISDGFVIAIPKDTHRANYGPNHRQKLKPIIEKLYNISYIIIEK